MMGWYKALLPLLGAICLAEQTEPVNVCTASPPPSCTLTFSPSAPAQTGPTTTLYRAIVTTSLNIVDCQYCTVTNIEGNAVAQGPFTAKVTEPVLTVVRAACIPETAVSTRGSHGTDDANAEKGPHPRTVQASDLDKRVTQSEQDLASEFADIIDPGNWTVMQSIQTYRRQCYSAFVAISLIISGADPQLLCNLTRSPELQLSLSNKGLDGQQVADLICFWSVFGYHFEVSVFQVLDTLATAATSFTYAIEYGLNSTQDIVRLCGGLKLEDDMYKMLRIDSQGIYTILCSNAVNGTSTSTFSSTITSVILETVSASSGQIVWTSWGSNGSVLITGTAGGFSWSNQIGTGSASATFGGSSWSASGGNTLTSAGGTAGSGSWSSGWGVNVTASATGAPWPTGVDFNATATGIGSDGVPFPIPTNSFPSFSSNGTVIVGSPAQPTISVTTFTDGNGSAIVSGTAIIPSNTPSWTLSNGTSIATANPVETGASSSWLASTGTGLASGVGTINATGIPLPSLSWTTFTDVNGSVVVSGSAATTVASSFAWTLSNGTGITSGAGGATGGSWSSGGGGGEIVSYTGLAWTSWIVSSRPTAAIITGTAGSIPWGTNIATAIITGSGQAVTFTVIQVTKTIVVVATAVGQTWSAWGASGSGLITGVGTAGTWTLDSGITSIVNGSSLATTVGDTWGNATISSANGTIPTLATPGVSIIPGDVPVITATGALNFTSTVVTTAITALSGSNSTVVNVTQVTTGFVNTTTTIIGADIPTGIATIGTGPVTTNSENITFSILSSTVGTIGTIGSGSVNGSSDITFSIQPWTSSKFSYPGWTTSTASSSV